MCITDHAHVGFARSRLSLENMPSYEKIKNFSVALERESGYKIVDESKASRVVLKKIKELPRWLGSSAGVLVTALWLPAIAVLII